MPSSSKTTGSSAVIWTEGKTDWKHLKRAAGVLSIDLDIQFGEYDTAMGDGKLLEKCRSHAEISHPRPRIFIFDRDNPGTVAQVTEPGKEFKNWGNKVYSFALPVPGHRLDHENLCIEFYYSDDDINTKDRNGRRLYLTPEFNELSGRHSANPMISVGNKHKLRGLCSPATAKIIDQEVYDEHNKNVALSKSDFADYVCQDVEPFNKLDFSAFRQVFDIVV